MVSRWDTSLAAAAVLAAIGAGVLVGAGGAAADPGSDPATSAEGDNPGPRTPAADEDDDEAGKDQAAEQAETGGTEDLPGETVPAADEAGADESVEPVTAPRRARAAEPGSPRDRRRSAFSARVAAAPPSPADRPAGTERPSTARAAAASAQPESARTEPSPAPVAPTVSSARISAPLMPMSVIKPVQKFVNAVGSTLLNVLMGVIQLFAGPPMLPAQSIVTVRTSTLAVPVGAGRKVKADWYFPDSEGEPPARLIYLQHGFGAVSSMYSHTAAELAQRTNSIVVAPSITSNFLDPGAVWLGGTPMQDGIAALFAGDRAALTESASAAAGHAVVLPTRFALVGHSLGATLVMGAAGRMTVNGAIDDLVGVVLLDGVDVNDTTPRALAQLVGANHVPVRNISSERYQWNRYGLISDQLQQARPGEHNGLVLEGGRHIDALQGGNPLLQFAEYVVAGFSERRNIEAVRTIAAGWLDDMFAGTDRGIYAEPGHAVQIPTSGRPAVAVGLPFTTTDSVRVTPWDGVMAVLLDALVKVAIYEPPTSAVLVS